MAKPDTYLESQQDDAFEAAREAGTFEPDEGWIDRRYSGSLIEDCASLRQAAQATVRPSLDLKAEVSRIHSEFCAMHGIREPYRPSDAEREAVCGGYYSVAATRGY